MSDMLADGLAILTQELTQYASTMVTYARGPDLVNVPALFGSKLLKIYDSDGGPRMEWTDLDFCIASALLVLGGQPVTPERGDLVSVTYGSEVQIFEALPYGMGESCWRWSDPHHSMMRIHTKWVDTQPVPG